MWTSDADLFLETSCDFSTLTPTFELRDELLIASAPGEAELVCMFGTAERRVVLQVLEHSTPSYFLVLQPSVEEAGVPFPASCEPVAPDDGAEHVDPRVVTAADWSVSDGLLTINSPGYHEVDCGEFTAGDSPVGVLVVPTAIVAAGVHAYGPPDFARVFDPIALGIWAYDEHGADLSTHGAAYRLWLDDGTGESLADPTEFALEWSYNGNGAQLTPLVEGTWIVEGVPLGLQPGAGWSVPPVAPTGGDTPSASDAQLPWWDDPSGPTGGEGPPRKTLPIVVAPEDPVDELIPAEPEGGQFLGNPVVPVVPLCVSPLPSSLVVREASNAPHEVEFEHRVEFGQVFRVLNVSLDGVDLPLIASSEAPPATGLGWATWSNIDDSTLRGAVISGAVTPAALVPTLITIEYEHEVRDSEGQFAGRDVSKFSCSFQVATQGQRISASGSGGPERLPVVQRSVPGDALDAADRSSVGWLADVVRTVVSLTQAELARLLDAFREETTESPTRERIVRRMSDAGVAWREISRLEAEGNPEIALYPVGSNTIVLELVLDRLSVTAAERVRKVDVLLNVVGLTCTLMPTPILRAACFGRVLKAHRFGETSVDATSVILRRALVFGIDENSGLLEVDAAPRAPRCPCPLDGSISQCGPLSCEGIWFHDRVSADFENWEYSNWVSNVWREKSRKRMRAQLLIELEEFALMDSLASETEELLQGMAWAHGCPITGCDSSRGRSEYPIDEWLPADFVPRLPSTAAVTSTHTVDVPQLLEGHSRVGFHALIETAATPDSLEAQPAAVVTHPIVVTDTVIPPPPDVLPEQYVEHWGQRANQIANRLWRVGAFERIVPSEPIATTSIASTEPNELPVLRDLMLEISALSPPWFDGEVWHSGHLRADVILGGPLGVDPIRVGHMDYTSTSIVYPDPTFPAASPSEWTPEVRDYAGLLVPGLSWLTRFGEVELELEEALRTQLVREFFDAAAVEMSSPTGPRNRLSPIQPGLFVQGGSDLAFKVLYDEYASEFGGDRAAVGAAIRQTIDVFARHAIQYVHAAAVESTPARAETFNLASEAARQPGYRAWHGANVGLFAPYCHQFVASAAGVTVGSSTIEAPDMAAIRTAFGLTDTQCLCGWSPNADCAPFESLQCVNDVCLVDLRCRQFPQDCTETPDDECCDPERIARMQQCSETSFSVDPNAFSASNVALGSALRAAAPLCGDGT